MNELWVEDGYLWRCHILHSDIRDSDVRRDHIRLGYWVYSDSVTATVLALKGCRLRPRLEYEMGAYMRTYASTQI